MNELPHCLQCQPQHGVLHNQHQASDPGNRPGALPGGTSAWSHVAGNSCQAEALARQGNRVAGSGQKLRTADRMNASACWRVGLASDSV